jgi:hypothetical protein
VKVSGAKRTVTDGPFAETKELVAGYWLWHRAAAAALISLPSEGQCLVQ